MTDRVVLGRVAIGLICLLCGCSGPPPANDPGTQPGSEEPVYHNVTVFGLTLPHSQTSNDLVQQVNGSSGNWFQIMKTPFLDHGAIAFNPVPFVDPLLPETFVGEFWHVTNIEDADFQTLVNYVRTRITTLAGNSLGWFSVYIGHRMMQNQNCGAFSGGFTLYYPSLDQPAGPNKLHRWSILWAEDIERWVNNCNGLATHPPTFTKAFSWATAHELGHGVGGLTHSDVPANAHKHEPVGGGRIDVMHGNLAQMADDMWFNATPLFCYSGTNKHGTAPIYADVQPDCANNLHRWRSYSPPSLTQLNSTR